MVVEAGRAAVADTAMLTELKNMRLADVTVEVEILGVEWTNCLSLCFDGWVRWVRVGDFESKIANDDSEYRVYYSQ